MVKIDMESIGLTEKYVQEASLYSDLIIGRVSSQSKDCYEVITENGEVIARISGKFRYKVRFLSSYPAVGDFVMIDLLDDTSDKGIIHHVLKRKNIFERKASGTSKSMQIVAANIDTVFICMSLNHDYNLRRLERYLSIACDSGTIPVLVLTKSDLCKDLHTKLNEVSKVAIGIDVLITSSISDEGFLFVTNYISRGITAAFIGSSGVGKSTLINKIVGEDIMDTKEIRSDDKGRHTTTRRELIRMPGGGAVIDTPGMRELGLDNVDVSKTFSDIDEFASYCKFHDCTHGSEPKCAVKQAIRNGFLSLDRLESYNKLKKEVKYNGLNSKQIEKEKINEMFSSFGGMKNAKKYIKGKNARNKK